MSDINPAYIMDIHEGVCETTLNPPICDECGYLWPCETYLLAEALAAEQAKAAEYEEKAWRYEQLND